MEPSGSGDCILSSCYGCICLYCTRMQCPYKGCRCVSCQSDDLGRVLDCDFFLNRRTVRVFKVKRKYRKEDLLMKKVDRILELLNFQQVTWDSFTVFYDNLFITTLQSLSAVREYLGKFSPDFRKKISVYDSSGREVAV